MTTHVDISKAKDQLAHLVDLAKAGNEIIIVEDDKPVVKLTPINHPEHATKRVPGLHKDSIWTSEDFDAPLPEDFLVGLK